MKKIIFSLCVVSIVISSCSSDSVSSASSSDKLVKELTYTSITDSYNETVAFTYNGNKLVKGVYDDGSEEIYTYNGNLITQIKLIEEGDVVVTESFSYDSNGRLTQYVFNEEGFGEQVENFVYNADGTATTTGSGTSDATLHFESNELVKIVQTGTGGRTYDYTYDTKNSPFRNVTGYGKIAHVIHGDHEFYGVARNIVSIHESTEDVDYMTNTITYNADDYPTFVNSSAIFESVPSTATIQYTYN